MSHFSVLVIGPDHAKQLQPFHEFECTGTDDEYVKEIDWTEKARADFAAQLAGGLDKTFTEWAEGWYGWRTVQADALPEREGDHKYGFIQVDASGEAVKCIDRTNPNKRWDWWSVGGRWTGFFQLRPGANGVLGTPGLMTKPAATGRADQARKSAIDFDGMRNDAGAKAGDLWDLVQAVTGGQKWEAWNSVRGRLKNVDEARSFYHEQPAVRELKDAAIPAFSWEIDDDASCPRSAYVQAARDAACSTFAIVHNGEWAERGRMGWFGMARDEMDFATWNRLFNEFLDGLPEDTLLTVVDCHI